MPSIHNVISANTCRSCGSSDMADVMDLKAMPTDNQPQDRPRGVGEQTELLPLRLALCATCALAQLRYSMPLEHHFSNYPYRTGALPGIKRHFEALANTVERNWLPPGGLVVEIGCNDGTFLHSLKRKRNDARLVGIDPAVNLRSFSVDEGIDIRTSFFHEELASELLRQYGPADVVVATNVLAHIDDLQGALWGFLKLLAHDGVVIIEFSHLGSLVDETMFPLIDNETLSYFSLTSLVAALSQANLRCIEAKRVVTHSGSLRLTACAASSPRTMSENATEVADSILHWEDELRLTEDECFEGLRQRVQAIERVSGALFRDLAADSRKVIGYGARPRTATYVHQLEIADVLDAIVDDNELVQDRFLARTDIPIIPTQVLASRRDSYCVVFEWENSGAAIRHLRDSGFEGQFILPCPEPRFPADI